MRNCLDKTVQEPGDTKFLTLRDGRLAYDDTGGKGPLIIALPGMGDLRGEYRHFTPILSRCGYRVVTVDVRGMGETSAKWNSYSAHAVSRDVIALIESIGAESTVIIGTSFSAGSALWAAYDAPEKIKGIVVISPMVKDYPTPFYLKAAMAVGLSPPWGVSFWIKYWDSLFPLHKPFDHAVYRSALAANLGEMGRMAALKKMIYLSKSDTEQIIAKVRTPALIVVGTKDKDFADPVGEGKSLASLMGADLFIAEGAGHYPQVEIPDAMAPAVIEFLQRVF
jgi:pimeloyl-ACP methyl ester carboxylesterase